MPVPKPTPGLFPTSDDLAIFLVAMSDVIERLQAECSDREVKRVMGILLRDVADCLIPDECYLN
jgi:hypothetical protein